MKGCHCKQCENQPVFKHFRDVGHTWPMIQTLTAHLQKKTEVKDPLHRDGERPLTCYSFHFPLDKPEVSSISFLYH